MRTLVLAVVIMVAWLTWSQVHEQWGVIATANIETKTEGIVGRFVRHYKPLLMLEDVTSVIIGGSRAEQSLQVATSRLGEPTGYNLSIPSVTLAEMDFLLEHALNVASLGQVTLSLPFAIFLRDIETQPGFSLEALFLDEVAGVRYWLTRYFSWRSFTYEAGKFYPAKVLGQEQFSSGRRIVDAAIAEKADVRGALEYYSRLYRSYGFGQGIVGNNLALFERVLRRLQAASMNVDIVILPVHDSLQAVRTLSDVDQVELDWVSSVSELARRYSVRSLRAYGEVVDVTSEPIRGGLNCTNGCLLQWNDPSHILYGRLPSVNDDAEFISGRLYDLLGSGELARYKQDKLHKNGGLRSRCHSIDDVMNNCFRDGVH